jgi:prophage antirepressor-like protein
MPFAFDDALVRIRMDENGDPWFVAKDVCRVLEISDHHQAVESLDEDERGRCIVPTPSGAQEMLIISESGLYSLIFKSRKPEARRVRKWVTSEVLPSIRKTGSYSLSQLSEVERRSLDYIPGATKRAVLKNLTDLVRERPERAAHLEADLVRLLLVLAPSRGQMEEWDQGEPSIVSLFWKACEKLHDMGITINHGDTPGLLHLDLDEISNLVIEYLENDSGGKSYRHPLGFSEVSISALKLTRKLPESAQYPLREKLWRFISKRTGEEIKPCWVFEDKRGRFKMSALPEAGEG